MAEPPSADPERHEVPDEIKCLLCDELLKDAVIVPCCAQRFCDDCKSIILSLT